MLVAVGFEILSHFLPATFLADLVVFPASSFFSTDLMTPTATVCLMSLTAKRPVDNMEVENCFIKAWFINLTATKTCS